MRKFTTNKLVGVLACMGVGLGLMGAGVYASYSDSATASQSIDVSGQFACALSSTDHNWVISPDGHTATLDWGTLNSSSNQPGASPLYSDLTIANTGSIPEVVKWTVTHGGTIDFQPTGRMGYTAGSPDMTGAGNNVQLAPGASQNYTNLGFQWAELTNADLGKSASVSYHADCGEVPPPAASKVQFVGIASEAGHAALTLPPGSQPGDIAVVLEAGSAVVATPGGYSNIATPVAPRNMSAYRVLVAGDTAVPAAATTVTDMEVAVYRGASGVGSHTYISGNLNNVGGTAYPLKCNALDGVSGPAMTKTDGSSWVMCMGLDTYASTNANQMVFDANTTNRSSGLADPHMGLADSNAGVATWATVGWPGDNFPLPGTHGVAVHTIELLSN